MIRVMRRSVRRETVIESVDLGGEVSVEILFGCVARSFWNVRREGSVELSGILKRGRDTDAGLLLLLKERRLWVESVGRSGSSDGGRCC